MEVDLQGTILNQFKLEIYPIIKFSNTHFSTLRMHSSFGEGFPTTLSSWKSLKVHCNNGQSMKQSAVSTSDNLRLPELSFNRLQPSDQECEGLLRHHFGRYLAREAFFDEEYWTAAWLRAEAHWESVSHMRHVDTYKRKYAEQEFYALKRRCSGIDGNSLRCLCLVAPVCLLSRTRLSLKHGYPGTGMVKGEEKNVRRTVLNSVVGTLDLSIRQFIQGETYPGEKKTSSVVLASQEPFGMHRYAYIANVCVSKFARRQKVASNMLHLATDAATSSGMKQLYVHVNVDNQAARDLYSKTGFKIVAEPSSNNSKDPQLLMLKEL